MRRGGSLFKTKIETKKRTLKCLKWHYSSTVGSMKNVTVLMEDGVYSLFFGPHPGEFDSSKVPAPRNWPSKAKKMLISGSFAVILLLILCQVKVKNYSLVESFSNSLPFCLFLCIIFIYNDVCFAIIIPP